MALNRGSPGRGRRRDKLHTTHRRTIISEGLDILSFAALGITVVDVGLQSDVTKVILIVGVAAGVTRRILEARRGRR